MEKDYGYVQDVTADLESGVITSIIVPGITKFFNMFAGNNDISRGRICKAKRCCMRCR